MIIGIPRELKEDETRGSATPSDVAKYVRRGHRVLIETSAVVASDFGNGEYEAEGGTIVTTNAAVFEQGKLVIKEKEPVPDEHGLLRSRQIHLAYLHLAADLALAQALAEQRVTAIAFETVQLTDGSVRLLVPMSEIAGRIATQVGAQYLTNPHGGIGLLPGGVPGVPPANVTVIGAGTSGTGTARVDLGIGAMVTIIDRNIGRLRPLEHALHGRFVPLASKQQHIAARVQESDLVIGAVLVPSGRAPTAVTREMVASMKPGSVIVDMAIDQGACVATSHPTTLSNPVYTEFGVIHYCVTNIPAAVPRTSTSALSDAILPYGLELADLAFAQAVPRDQALERGVNMFNGQVTNRPVADALGLPYTPLADLL
jgi:alanine dehydrogenase